MTSSKLRLSLMRVFTFRPSSSSGAVLNMCAASGVARVIVSCASQMRMPSLTVPMMLREMTSNRWASSEALLYFDSVSASWMSYSCSLICPLMVVASDDTRLIAWASSFLLAEVSELSDMGWVSVRAPMLVPDWSMSGAAQAMRPWSLKQ